MIHDLTLEHACSMFSRIKGRQNFSYRASISVVVYTEQSENEITTKPRHAAP